MLGCFQRVHKCLRSRCRFVLKEISQTMVTTILKPHFPKFLPISWPWIEGHSAIFVHVTHVTLAVQEPAELVDVWTPGTMPAAPAKPRPARLENASHFFGGKPWFDSCAAWGWHSLWHRNNPSQRRVLQKSYAREQSGGGGTDVRRPIRPDGQETSMDISGVLSFQVPPIWIYMAQTWLAGKSPSNMIPSF
jgi:hypothetical protein